MKTLRQVEVTPVFVDYIPEWDKMEEAHIYVSRKYNASLHLCLCGCKGEVSTPLNSAAHPNQGWDITEDSKGQITMAPSIGNFQKDCKSHYIITKNVANFV